MSKKKQSKILWAVDPYMGDQAGQLRTAKLLIKMTEDEGLEIEPIYVLSPPNPITESRWVADYLAETDEVMLNKMRAWGEKLKCDRIVEPVLLKQNGFSTRKASMALVEYAKDQNVKMIGVSTHARKGIKRAMMGSFCETLVNISDIPVVVLSPKAKVSKKFGKILFPTDFSEASEKAFAEVLQFAKAKQSKLLLFNKVEFITEYTLPTLDAVPDYQKQVKKEIEFREKTGKEWIEMGEELGVKVEFIIDKRQGNVENGILRLIKSKNPSLVALASESSLVASALLGSVAREVIRKSGSPVWMIHPKDNEVEKRESQDTKAYQIESGLSLV